MALLQWMQEGVNTRVDLKRTFILLMMLQILFENHQQTNDLNQENRNSNRKEKSIRTHFIKTDNRKIQMY